jgi:hypothetical protein
MGRTSGVNRGPRETHKLLNGSGLWQSPKTEREMHSSPAN